MSRSWMPVAGCRVLGVVAAMFIAAERLESAEPDAAASPDETVKIRVIPPWSASGLLRQQLEGFRRAHPRVGFEMLDSRPSPLVKAQLLAQGKADVALLPGPLQANGTYCRMAGKPRRDVLIEKLKAGGCDCHRVAWLIMAVVVHPANPLAEMDQSVFEQIQRGKITSWKSLGQEDQPIQMFADRILRTQRLEDRQQLAHNRYALGLLQIDKDIEGSGLKFVAVRPPGAEKAVLPSPENVAAGAYPFCDYLLIAVRPNAPKTVRDFARQFRGPAFGRWLGHQYRAKLDYRLPEPGKDDIWPLPVGRSEPSTIAARVAVLPLEHTSQVFVVADARHHAMFEQAIVDGISASGQTKMVDRSQLSRVLRELRLGLALGKEKPSVALAPADLLVFSSIVSQRAEPWLVIQAVDVSTTGCLGRMRLSIDPSKMDALADSLREKVAAWWPGVLGNLAAARRRPLWTALPPVWRDPKEVSIADFDRAFPGGKNRVSEAFEHALADDQRIYFAKPSLLPEAQREILIRFMDQSDSPDKALVPPADYLIDPQMLPAGMRLRILRGSDLVSVAEEQFAPQRQEGDVQAWLAAQIDALPHDVFNKDSAAAPSRGKAARAQAQLMLKHGQHLKELHPLLVNNKLFYKHYDENTQTLHEKLYRREETHLKSLLTESDGCFQRAAQLDPTCEKAAYQSTAAVCRRPTRNFSSCRRLAEAAGRFVDNFPNSDHAYKMAGVAGVAYHTLASYLYHDGRTDRSGRNALYFHPSAPHSSADADSAKRFQRHSLRYLGKYFAGLTLDKKGLKNFTETLASNSSVERLDRYHEAIYRYHLMGASAANLDEVLAEYDVALGRRPDLALPAEFLRLRCHAGKKDKAAYVNTLAAMQRRWPDSRDVHWKLGREQALEDLSKLFETDRRGTSFYWWLRGKRGIGDLPWEGYEE